MEGCWWVRVEKINVGPYPPPLTFWCESSKAERIQKAFRKSTNAQMTHTLHFLECVL